MENSKKRHHMKSEPYKNSNELAKPSRALVLREQIEKWTHESG